MITVGSRLGGYDIIARIGAGGMGEVFHARDVRLGRDVAIKVLPDAVASDPERLQRFQREAQVLASLNHPHIGAIYGLEEADGVRALVLELVEGDTLADHIARGPIPVDDALSIAKQIAEALESAHEQGIIHRDLKPANIKVDPDGRVKVLDFGLAKLVESPATAADPSALSMSPTITTPAMTQLGMILGTAAYMSPEQAKGRPADKRSDVWAFGCVLFEMLSGKRAFEGEDVSDTLAAVLRGDPDWNRLPVLPDSVNELLIGALRKDRRARIGDIAVARFLLDRPATASAASAHAGVSRRRLLIVSAAAAAVGGLGGGLGVYAMRPHARRDVVRSNLPLADGSLFSSVALRGLDISHDGQQVAYSADQRLHVRPLDTWQLHTIGGTGESAGSPVFSPDGKSVAFFSLTEQALKRIPVTGGAPLLLAALGDAPFGVSWSHGSLWAGQGEKGIARIPESGGGDVEQVATPDRGYQMATPSILPGGEWLMFALAKTGRPYVWDSAEIVVQSLKTKERRTVLRGGNNPRYVESGHLVYGVEGTLFAVPFDLRTMQPEGTPTSVVAGVRRGFATAPLQYSVSDTGTLVYIPGPARLNSVSTVFMIGSLTEPPEALPLQPGPYLHPRVDSAGNRIAFIREEGGASELWLYDRRRADAPRRITYDGRTRHPVWTRDGLAIAVQSEQDGTGGIFLQSPDGSRRRVTTAGDGEVHVPESISKDGWLLFSLLKNSAYGLWMVRLDGTGMQAFNDIRSMNQTDAVFSPDDQWVAYAYTEHAGGAQTPDRGVYVEPFPPAAGSKLQVPKIALDYHPSWSANGNSLYYLPGASRRLARVAFDRAARSFGQPVAIQTIGNTGHLGNDRRQYDVLPDNRFLLVLDPQAGGIAPSTSISLVVDWFEELRRMGGTNQ